MGRLSVVVIVFFVLTSNWLGATAWAQPPSCSDLLSHDSVQEPLRSLVQLRVQLSTMIDPGLRARLEDDFQLKILQLHNGDVAQVENTIKEIRKELRRLTREPRRIVSHQEILKAQACTLADPGICLRPVVDLTEPGLWLPNFTDSFFKYGLEKNSDGVMWSYDDQYVAVRPYSSPTSAEVKPTRIYDLRTGEAVGRTFQFGVLAREGPYWAQPKAGGGVEVIHILTGETVATADGYLHANLGRPFANSLLTKQTLDPLSSTIWTHYSQGAVDLGLGTSFVVSPDNDLLAYVNFDEARVLQMTTGKQIHFSQDLSQASFAVQRSQDALYFQQAGQKTIIDLKNLRVYRPSSKLTAATLVAGGPWVFNQPVSRQESKVFRHLENGNELRYSGEVIGNHDHTVFIKNDNEEWDVVNLDTGVRDLIPGQFDQLVAKRWLVNPKAQTGTLPQPLSSNSPSLVIYDSLTGQHHNLDFSGTAVPLNGADLWIWRNQKNGVERVWISSLELGAVKEPGSNHVVSESTRTLKYGVSPSGRYFIGERDGKIVISRIEYPPK